LVKNLDSLFFSDLALIESLWSHDLGHGSKRLAQVDFGLFLKHFFQIFLPVFFRFSIYRVISISCPSHVFDLFTGVGCLVHLRLLFIFISYQQVSISYIFLKCSAFRNIFYGVSLSIIFFVLSFKLLIFYGEFIFYLFK